MIFYIDSQTMRSRILMALCLFILVAGVFSQKVMADDQSAEKLYNSTCAHCHSRSLPPFVGPELRGRSLPEVVTKTFVRQGARGMITFSEATISDAQLDELAQWIQSSPAPKRLPMGPQK